MADGYGQPAYDWVLGVMPDEWGTLSPEQKAVSAMAPFSSLALILDGDNSTFTLGNLDAARVIKALVDRAELLLGIPGQSITASEKEARPVPVGQE
ncbi:MAG: hypothetical protein AAGU21_10385 [Solidesulfovibrio sp.]|uniref:hypothetical protein n=1 Tax=Solidesulfovibrio sp. TaxID=2910990 RepID=UPI002B2205D2|nr:hypothetical protein [Solidesulfovibrio sp.]MEA4855209.1 hypothetical protein [Solidesulfovibrio sp.]